jgi:hypothetical protein
MSVSGIPSPEALITGDVVVTADGEACFYCGHPTSDPALVWAGETETIFLHAGCWIDWSIRMNSDLHRLQRATGMRFRQASE